MLAKVRSFFNCFFSLFFFFGVVLLLFHPVASYAAMFINDYEWCDSTGWRPYSDEDFQRDKIRHQSCIASKSKDKDLYKVFDRCVRSGFIVDVLGGGVKENGCIAAFKRVTNNTCKDGKIPHPSDSEICVTPDKALDCKNKNETFPDCTEVVPSSPDKEECLEPLSPGFFSKTIFQSEDSSGYDACMKNPRHDSGQSIIYECETNPNSSNPICKNRGICSLACPEGYVFNRAENTCYDAKPSCEKPDFNPKELEVPPLPLSHCPKGYVMQYGICRKVLPHDYEETEQPKPPEGGGGDSVGGSGSGGGASGDGEDSSGGDGGGGHDGESSGGGSGSGHDGSSSDGGGNNGSSPDGGEDASFPDGGKDGSSTGNEGGGGGGVCDSPQMKKSRLCQAAGKFRGNCYHAVECSGDAVDCAIARSTHRLACEVQSRKASSGGGKDGCDTPPKCFGDSINCQILYESWKTRCVIQRFSDDSLAAQFEEDSKKGVENWDEIINNPVQQDVGGWFTAKSYFSYAESCPPDIKINFFGETITLSSEVFCDALRIMRSLLQAVAWLFVLRLFFLYLSVNKG